MNPNMWMAVKAWVLKMLVRWGWVKGGEGFRVKFEAPVRFFRHDWWKQPWRGARRHMLHKEHFGTFAPVRPFSRNRSNTPKSLKTLRRGQ